MRPRRQTPAGAHHGHAHADAPSDDDRTPDANHGTDDALATAHLNARHTHRARHQHHLTPT